jgi:dihydrofolate reductase
MLLKHRLAEEVILIVYSVFLGKCKGLFAGSRDPRELALVSTKNTATGVLIKSYQDV